MYRGLLTLPWETHVRPQGTFAVDVVGESPRWLRHTQFAALRAKDAIVDRMREHSGDAAVGRPGAPGPAGQPALRARAGSPWAST